MTARITTSIVFVRRRDVRTRNGLPSELFVDADRKWAEHAPPIRSNEQSVRLIHSPIGEMNHGKKINHGGVSASCGAQL